MIIKSLIIASIIFNMLGLSGLSDKVDRAVIRHTFDPTRSVVASDISLSMPVINARPYVKPFAPKPDIYAKNWLIGDMQSGKILIGEDAAERVPIASTTKIMTAVVVLAEYDLSDIVTVSKEASYQIGADAHLVAGERITVENLLKALLIKSGNDTAYALAEHMNKPGETGIQKFTDKMNQKALELGLDDTNYKDPAGLNTDGYSSAKDLFILTRYALRDLRFKRIVSTKEAVVTNVEGDIWHELKTSNRLVGEYEYLGAIGVKTGYMPKAGHILVSAAEREGHTLIGVVINTYADTVTASAIESVKLLDWGFANISWKDS